MNSDLESGSPERLENLNDIEQYQIRFKTKKGFELYGRLYRNPEKSQDPDSLGLVAIHGTTSHGGTFKKAVEPLLKTAEYAWVLTPDTPGHARSKTIKGRVEVEDYSAALGEFVDHLYQQGLVSGNRVLVGNSGHAAMTVQMYNDDWEKQNRGDGGGHKVSGVILSAPAYDAKETFLGRLGPIVIELIRILPKRINIPQIVTKIYGNWFASNSAESKIQKERKVELNNESLYQDLKAMMGYASRHKVNGEYKPVVADSDMNVAIIKSKKDNLCDGDENRLYKLHGENAIIKVTGKDVGHHPQKRNPEAYSLLHKKILKDFGLERVQKDLTKADF